MFYRSYSRAESQQLKHELETQPLTVEQRTKLLDEVDYALRVQDSKRSLAEQIGKVLLFYIISKVVKWAARDI